MYEVLFVFFFTGVRCLRGGSRDDKRYSKFSPSSLLYVRQGTSATSPGQKRECAFVDLCEGGLGGVLVCECVKGIGPFVLKGTSIFRSGKYDLSLVYNEGGIFTPFLGRNGGSVYIG